MTSSAVFLIPDETALHLLMLSASVREDESDDKKGRANAVLQSLKLDTADRNAFALQANQYRKDFLETVDAPAIDEEAFRHERHEKLATLNAKLKAGFSEASYLTLQNQIQEAKRHADVNRAHLP